MFDCLFHEMSSLLMTFSSLQSDSIHALKNFKLNLKEKKGKLKKIKTNEN